MVYCYPGPRSGGPTVLHVGRLLGVEDEVQPHQGAGQGGGPEGRQAPRHVGVEGETISIPRTEVNFKVAEENNNY